MSTELAMQQRPLLPPPDLPKLTRERNKWVWHFIQPQLISWANDISIDSQSTHDRIPSHEWQERIKYRGATVHKWVKKEISFEELRKSA